VSLLSVEQLLDQAVMLETRGEEFFRGWIGKTNSGDLDKFFALLSDEEALHKKRFEALKKTIQDDSFAGEIPAEHADYFKTLADDILFNTEETKAVDSLQSALELAKKQELDSILFYTDIQTYLPEGHEEVFKEIINEERKHYVKLTELEKKLIKLKNKKGGV
jgi:rubrerythrin